MPSSIYRQVCCNVCDMDIQLLHRAKILIVDDEADNIALVREILRRDGYTAIYSTTDPCEVKNLMQELEPDLILLDLHMPRLNGFGVMQQVKEQAEEQVNNSNRHPLFLPIMVVSGDYNQDVKKRALASGAKDFLPRPFDSVEIKLRIQNLLEARFLQIQLQEQNDVLEERVCERTKELEQAHLKVKEAQIEIITRLAVAGELHDNETGEHTQRVSLVASLIAQNMGMGPEEVELLRRAAPLHDVGKIGVADPILLKKSGLTQGEFNVIKDHCRIGAHVLSGGNADLVKMAEVIALTHHERWDGKGYPQGLKGEEIPLVARILSVADVFDALTHERPYKKAWSVEAAVEEIRNQSGKQFDPQAVEAFLSLPHEELL
jgi:putative two-component system response regulator